MEYKGYTPNAPSAARRDFHTPAAIDEDLYAMAKRRVFDRGALIKHTAAFGAGSCAMLVVGNTILDGREQPLVVLALLWGVAVVTHIAAYFVKASPEKVLKEYDRITRRI